jgi:TonB family protein
MEQSLRDALERVRGLDDGLAAEAEFNLLADGRAARARLTVSSHDQRFDAAVLQAIASLRLPPRPPGMPEIQRLPFSTYLRH